MLSLHRDGSGSKKLQPDLVGSQLVQVGSQLVQVGSQFRLVVSQLVQVGSQLFDPNVELYPTSVHIANSSKVRFPQLETKDRIKENTKTSLKFVLYMHHELFILCHLNFIFCTFSRDNVCIFNHIAMYFVLCTTQYTSYQGSTRIPVDAYYISHQGQNQALTKNASGGARVTDA